MTATNSSKFSYQIISTTPFNEAIQSSSINSYLDDSLGVNEVQGILTTGYFGSYKSILLSIKSGLEVPIDYDLFIDENGNNKFKKTSTVANSAYPSLEVWQDYIHSVKISGFRKAKIESVVAEIKLDTTCNSSLDIEKGNNLLDEQLKFVFDLIYSADKTEIDRIKEYEKTINSVSETNWGWKNELFVVTEDGRYLDGYINSKPIAQPLVYKLTECPYMEREIGYFFTKSKKDVKLVLFVWKLRWVEGWQSRAYNSITNDFRLKNEFIIKSLSSRMGNPIKTNKTPKNVTNSWRTKDGVEVESDLFVDKDSFSLKLYVYIKNK